MGKNIIRSVGDMCHLFSIVTLLWQLIKDKSAKGISLRSHELYILVFVARYLDLFTTFYSLYNFSFKLFYICSTSTIIYLIRFQFPIKDTYDRSQDTLPHWKLVVVPSLLIASVIYLLDTDYHYIDPIRLMWTFSIILESVAMAPQLFIFYRCRDIARSTALYIAFRGVYRSFYILNWIYRAHTDPFFRYNWIATVCAIVQTILYADFFGYYIKSGCSGETPTSSDSEELYILLDEEDPEPLVSDNTESLLSPEDENHTPPEALDAEN